MKLCNFAYSGVNYDTSCRRLIRKNNNNYINKLFNDYKTFSVGPPETKTPLETGDMVSRRKILSRSRDDLTYIQNEEDVWYSKDKLVRVSKVF